MLRQGKVVDTGNSINKFVNNNDLSFQIYKNDENNEEAEQTDHRHKGSLCCTQGVPFLQLLAIS